MRSNNPLWRWLALIFVLSFGALGYLGAGIMGNRLATKLVRQ